MRVVVVGNGKVGHTLIEQLSKEGHDLVVIDNNRRALEESTNVLDVMGISGNGASYRVQVEAEVNKADLLIAVTNADELNILCCLVAKKLGVQHTIARVRNPEYSDQLMFIQDELGLSMSINPEFAAADEIFRMLRLPGALTVEVFSRGKVEMVELKLTAASPFDGLPLSELYKKYQIKVLVCAVQRGREVFIPSGDFILRAGDKINVTAAPGEIEELFRVLGMFHPKARNVMLVGGGRIAHYLARRLLEMGMYVKIIDNDPQRCRILCEVLPKAMIIQGDGTDQELLREEGIDTADSFVSLTGVDEENIILSLYAQTRGVRKVITKVNRGSLIELVGNVGLDSIISPKDITANQIIRYVRAMQNSLGSNVETLYKIVDGRAEALEFKVVEGAPMVGIPLKDLTLRPNLLIACIIRGGKAILRGGQAIIRGGQTILPGGNDCIMADDRVIVVTTNSGLRDLNDILG